MKNHGVHITFILLWSNILFTGADRKDICEKCVRISDCPAFANMNTRQQHVWLEQVPCNGPSNSGRSSIFGFSPVAKGDYVCCPNSNVWGIDKGYQDQPVPIRPNDRGHHSHHHPDFDNQDPFTGQQHNLPGNPNFDNGADDESKIQPRPDLYGNPQNGQNNNMFGNTPNQNGQQFPDNGNNNFGYPSQNGQNMNGQYANDQFPKSHYPNGQFPNNRYPNSHLPNSQYPNTLLPNGQLPNNQFPNTQFPNSQLPNNQLPNDQSTNSQFPNSQFPNSEFPNNNQFPNNQFPNSQFPNNNFPNNRFPNNQNPNFNGQNQFPNEGNERGYQQCPSQTNMIPDPSTGCCGKDDSDSVRITDLQKVLSMYAPSNTNRYPRPDYSSQQNQQRLPYYRRRHKRSPDFNNTSDDALEDRIAGGKETELDQFPWTVLLKVTFDYGNKEAAFSCGGSLISQRFIITAGHCVYEAGAKVTDVEITLAEYDKRTFPKDCISEMGGDRECVENIRMHAENIIHHPQYDDDQLHNDIALIKLHGYAPYTRFIRPVCLPPLNIDDPDLSNLPLAVAGWGRDGPYETNIKQSTVVHLVPHDKCVKSYPQLTASHLCAAGRTGEDTCKGDSGGPLMMLYKGNYYIIGVVSGKRADSPCGTSVPSLYTNVYQYVPWITSSLRN